MSKSIRISHKSSRYQNEKFGLPEILEDVAYVFAFLLLLGLMLMPYLARFF